MRGRAVFVVAPGPSLDQFPKSRLDDFVTIGVNSAAELMSPTFWLFQEGLFMKKYYPIYNSSWIKSIVTVERRAEKMESILQDRKWIYTYQSEGERVLKRSGGEFAPWRNLNMKPTFLPGRNSVAANAISLAVLMEAKVVVLVGVDLAIEDDGKYYANGVKRNPGPKNRPRALSASRAWMSKAAKYGVWRGPKLLTTSPYLRFRNVRRCSIGEAISEAEEAESSGCPGRA
jgi:hypothetical protein